MSVRKVISASRDNIIYGEIIKTSIQEKPGSTKPTSKENDRNTRFLQICVIENEETSGTIILHKDDGGDRKSTFQQNIQIIRQWSEILRQNWDFDQKCDKYICDEHFDENHIIRIDIITIPGQQPFISDRKKIMLKRNSIPTLNKNNSASGNAIGSIAENIFKSVAVASEEYAEPVNLMNEDGNMEPNIIGEVEYRNAELSESPSNFSIYDFIKHLETHKLPKKWS
ncbi:hypothetical protein PV328_007721 [Microctonus aethiopoides]|uniref:THAP-type domain-containing protein n=1 Tax=Microctonus aethiopoides TaxID=144406 RepID=A0AA39C9I5_9HYME|nr:hypothetical protein PV328_007721 [Microctonus aethiopoides]